MSDLNRREEFRVSRLKEMERVSAELLGAIDEALKAGLEGEDFANAIAPALHASFVAQYSAEQRSPFAVKDTPKQAWDWFYGKVKAGLDAVVESSEAKRIADWLGTATVNGAKVAGTESERKKMWLSRRDDKVRPKHTEADGQTVAWSAPFVVDGFEFSFPGEPVGPPELWLNCRCAVANSVDSPVASSDTVWEWNSGNVSTPIPTPDPMTASTGQVPPERAGGVVSGGSASPPTVHPASHTGSRTEVSPPSSGTPAIEASASTPTTSSGELTLTTWPTWWSAAVIGLMDELTASTGTPTRSSGSVTELVEMEAGSASARNAIGSAPTSDASPARSGRSDRTDGDSVIGEAITAAADPEATGKVIVAIPAADDPIHQASSEPTAHMTLIWLGKGTFTDEQMAALRAEVAEAAESFASGSHEGLSVVCPVKSREKLGDDEADVLMLEPGSLESLRDYMLMQPNIKAAHDATEQYPVWTPHVTVTYPHVHEDSEDGATIGKDHGNHAGVDSTRGVSDKRTNPVEGTPTGSSTGRWSGSGISGSGGGHIATSGTTDRGRTSHLRDASMRGADTSGSDDRRGAFGSARRDAATRGVLNTQGAVRTNERKGLGSLFPMQQRGNQAVQGAAPREGEGVQGIGNRKTLDTGSTEAIFTKAGSEGTQGSRSTNPPLGSQEWNDAVDAIRSIKFDRIALWDGDYEGEEYPMSVAVEEDAPVVEDDDLEMPEMDEPGNPYYAEPVPWNGVLAPEGVPSGDGRRFSEGALEWRDLPIPLLWQKSNGMGHEGAVIVGQIADIWRDGNLVRAKGFFADTPEADEVIGLYAEGHARGVSVDVDSAEMAVEDEEAQSVLFSKGRISAATLCAIPAFAEAYVVIGEWVEPVAEDSEVQPMVASPTGPVTGGEDVLLPFPAKMGACACRGCDVFDCGETGCACCWSYDSDDNPVFAPTHPRDLVAAAEFKRGPGWVTDPVATKRIVPTGTLCSCHDALTASIATSPATASAPMMSAGSGKAAGTARATDATAIASLTASSGKPSTDQFRLGSSLTTSAGSGSASTRHIWTLALHKPTSSGAGVDTGTFTLSAAEVCTTCHLPKHGTSGVEAGLAWLASATTTAGLSLGAFGRGPGWVTDPVATKKIHDYWTVPGHEGYAKIAWGTPGDFRRLRSHLAKFIGPEFLNRTTAQWHHDALGYWPGEAGKPGNPPVGARRGLAGDAIAASVHLVASAVTDAPLSSAWFSDPSLNGPTPLTVTDDGRVFGHLATWGVCHIGIPGTCVEAPQSQSEYAYFRTGAVQTEIGLIPVGQITMDTGHAPLSAGAKVAASHYDHSGSAVADVACGDDEYGIWVAGALRDSVPAEKVAALRAGALSGDWRTIRGALELVAALLVNVPGFPIPRVGLAASGGMQTSLVAAGVLPASAQGDEVASAVADLVAAVADEVEMRAKRRSRAKYVLDDTKGLRVAALLNKMEV